MPLTGNALDEFKALPGRLLLDTCVLNLLQDEGPYVFEGELPDGRREDELSPELRALRRIFRINQRAMFQFVVSPLTIGELAAVPGFSEREARVRWALDVLDSWQIAVWESADQGARQRRSLPAGLAQVEQELMQIPDLRRSPYDRLLLLETRLAECDAFLTTDQRTILRHREKLFELGRRAVRPSEFWQLLEPWAALWS